MADNRIDSSMNTTQVMEIIELNSDEEAQAKSPKTKSAKPYTNNCINFKCTSGIGMKPAPSFAWAFYGCTKKKKKQICDVCFHVAAQHQEQLVKCLEDRKPLLECDFPDHSMEVEISDSDESDDEDAQKCIDDDRYVPEELLLDIESKLDDALTLAFEKYNINYQVSQAHEILRNQWKTVDESNEELDKQISAMMCKMDNLRNGLYNDFRPQIRMLEELQIDVETPDSSHCRDPLVATKKVTQVRQATASSCSDPQLEILPLEGVESRAVTADLPPAGPLLKPVPEIADLVYIMKHPLMSWVKGRIQSVISRSPAQYRVKIMSKKNNSSQMKTVFGRQLAVATPCSVLIPVGARVVAIFNDINACGYYSGVIAEPPKSTNKYRYLVFFDDGYAQYVLHKHILLVSEYSLHVWEDIPKESQDFVKKYMESYPERPMVKLQPGQMVKTEWNSKWWIAKVLAVDASLVQMLFIADGRNEWIYRGSARLGPLFCELFKANARQHGVHASRNHTILPSGKNRNNEPYVEYTSFKAEDEDKKPSETPVPLQKGGETQTNTGSTIVPANNPSTLPTSQQTRAVAKKSTTKKQNAIENIIVPSNLDAGSNTKPSHSIVYYQTQNKIQTRKFVPHKCGPRCVEGISFTPDDLRGYSPLSIPLLCGWNRQLCKFAKGRKVILYQAPCGVRLRKIEELHLYLRLTGSPMSVDLFDYDHWVHCLAEFVLDKCFVNIKDLSYGVENVPIPCVNELDHALPDTIRYSTQRQPMEGVNLNLDPEFLCGCDCKDDCQDKSKCACWQLTIKGATLGDRVSASAVGYVYKRLPEPVTTGIYECNSRCKCSVKTCLNRVVQHPLTLKLQVFKTGPRGWGIRCLNDIPQGSFICIYAGNLLTEQGANEGGKNYGDEYLAELDYVEVVEGIKEGYESDVDPELQKESTDSDKKANTGSDEEYKPNPAYDSDEDFNINIKIPVNTDPASSFRKRLRKRKTTEKDDQAGSEDTSEDGSINKAVENMAIKSSVTPTPEIQPPSDFDLITISDDDDDANVRREPSRFEPSVEAAELGKPQFKTVRELFGQDEAVYIMDAKTTGNIGRYLNHSCDPNVFVQNVFVDTHDVRFPWVAFFALNYIRAGQELTWNYSYDVGSIPGKVIICRCGSSNCRGRLL